MSVKPSKTHTVISALKLFHRRYFKPIKRYSGNPSEICEQIIEDVWNGTYFQTSIGHYNYFYMRDFGTVCQSLIKLGHGDRVRKTLGWALEAFKHAKHTTTCVSNNGRAFNAPERAIDSLPWLTHCLLESKYKLTDSDRKFLVEETERYMQIYLDKKTHLPRLANYVELRDSIRYRASSYALSLIARMAYCLPKLGIKSNLPDTDYYRNVLDQEYWNGSYYSADLGNSAFSGECALMPFFLDVISDKRKLEATIKFIEHNKLDEPLPLRFTRTPDAFRQRFMQRIAMPNYAGTNIWTWLGGFYAHTKHKHAIDSLGETLAGLEKTIADQGTFLELLNPDGTPYVSWFYKTDDGMIWCALYLSLLTQKAT